MFKKAVQKLEASQTKQNSLKNQFLPSSSPDAPRTGFVPFKPPSMIKPTPLAAGSGNIRRSEDQATPHNGGLQQPSSTASRGVKRTSSGLTKALEGYDLDFDFPLKNSQENPINLDDDPQPKAGKSAVYFDENDFDSDIDLDVEDPTTKGTVEYPTLPATRPEVPNSSIHPPATSTTSTLYDASGLKQQLERAPSTDSAYFSTSSTHIPSSKGPNFTATRPAAQSVAGNDWEKGVHTRDLPQLGQFNPSKRVPNPSDSSRHPPPSSADPFPWSSSPLEHMVPSIASRTNEKSAQLQKFAYGADQIQDNERARAKKRRTLPWEKASAQTRGPSPPPARSQPASSFMARNPAASRQTHIKDSLAKEVQTPARKNADKALFPWNTTASAIKEQQKALKQANNNKKLVKSNEATDDGLKDAIARQKKNKVARVFLSEEQQHVLDLVCEKKKSVFFTGSAGTGKSVLLREIISGLRKKYHREPDRVAVTASTGLAACNIGGVTLHSFAGIGLGKETPEELVKKIKKNQKARHRWMRTKALVVDEISMVDGELFDKLEAVARTIRNNGRPFGGIQVVITGDFFQLPPVPDKGKIAKFAFDAGTWSTAIEHTIALHHVFRQKDPVFANMLNEMREGRLAPESIAAFRKLERPIHWDDAMDATELYPRREEVDRANNVRMQQLNGDVQIYEAKDSGSITDINMRNKLLSNCIAPETVALKRGCQVMLIKNFDETLVNGSLGRVIGFMSEATFDHYHENEEEFHELAAARDEDLNANQKKMKARLDVMASTAQTYPLVRFAIADGTTRDMLCNRESWKVELPNGEVQASRSQVPLILAWALSIHKAQGQTLDRVKVDLGKVFEKGQAYVALSRATTMEGLQVLRFDPKKVMAHERVRNFYKGLSRAEHVAAESKKAPAASNKKVRDKKDIAEDYERAFLEASGDMY